MLEIERKYHRNSKDVRYWMETCFVLKIIFSKSFSNPVTMTSRSHVPLSKCWNTIIVLSAKLATAALKSIFKFFATKLLPLMADQWQKFAKLMRLTSLTATANMSDSPPCPIRWKNFQSVVARFLWFLSSNSFRVSGYRAADRTHQKPLNFPMLRSTANCGRSLSWGVDAVPSEKR